MNTMLAFMNGQAARERGDEHMVFDWHKAARLIVERKPSVVCAGLRGDWGYTGGTIYSEGKPVVKDESYTYLSSNWAKPKIEIDGERVECWVYQSAQPAWNADTSWPDSALEILHGGL